MPSMLYKKYLPAKIRSIMCTIINKAANFGKNLINLDTVLGEQQTSIHPLKDMLTDSENR